MRKNFLAISLITCIFNVTLVNQAKADPTPLTIYAAGSLTEALSEIAQNFTQEYGIPVNTAFGPSGLMRQRLENGEQADIFASADLGNPLTLSQENLSGSVVTFASNSLSAVARPGLSLTPDNLLDQMLNPDNNLGAATPITDPLGDYTQEVFRKADQIKPGSFQILDAKAIRLSGGPNSPPVPAGRNSLVYFIQDTHQADIFLAYYTSALSAVKQSPTLQAVKLPDSLAVAADFGLTVMKNASPDGEKLEQYILSPEGQNILEKYGFNPSLTGVPEPEDVGEIALAFGVALLIKKKFASSKKRQLIISQSRSLEELSILHPESTRQTSSAEVTPQSVKG